MPAAIDRRAARTRKALHAALITLITERRFDEITVQDIIDEADVGRSTFYAHYTGKEDLLRRGFEILRVELIEAQGVSASRGAGEAADPIGFSTAMFEHAGRFKDIFRGMLGSRGSAIAIREIRLILAEIVAGSLPQDGPATARAARVQFVVGAMMSMLSWWIEERPSLPAAEVDRMFRALALDGIGADRVDEPRRQ